MKKQTLLDFFHELRHMNVDFTVVGSLALQAAGIPLRREPDDIDIEVHNVTEEQKNVFKTLDAFSNLVKTYGNNAPLAFMFAGVKVNIWYCPLAPDMRRFTVDSIHYKNVQDVLTKKMEYGRQKDHEDLAYIVCGLSSLHVKEQ